MFTTYQLVQDFAIIHSMIHGYIGYIYIWIIIVFFRSLDEPSSWNYIFFCKWYRFVDISINHPYDYGYCFKTLGDVINGYLWTNIDIDGYTLSIYPSIHPSIWVNDNNSLTWNKAILGWFLLLTHDSRVRSQWGHYNLPRSIYLPNIVRSCLSETWVCTVHPQHAEKKVENWKMMRKQWRLERGTVPQFSETQPYLGIYTMRQHLRQWAYGTSFYVMNLVKLYKPIHICWIKYGDLFWHWHEWE